ncbi:MAG: YbaB/EbfC family nucleoid-associated protein [Crocinitomicaceae bacterium]|nr:YbaB/EbfC family nucleoid-associated protein [Crocinitomicaceae bacterium]MDG1658055.1 YbaB/EbfC family nucleoid-associated protein [Crocinitomicaceae bacterium]MDG2441356.1 YbaB/EbfC family nucleoid-associated protein [Crocinitomicaceae bacterium]|tara:strand:- start:4794 stop:5093 length:300 start_codon:yes stop_codon:yes gene_type:complete
MLDKNLLDKLENLKRQSEASKERLDDIIIDEESGGGLIRVSMTGNRAIKGFEITGDVTQIDKEELEELICVAFNRALEKVNKMNEKEVMSSAQSLFSGM